MQKRNWLALSSALAAFFAFQGGAQAQTAPAPASPSTDATTDSGEIIITATKRDEALQTVPLAVSAFGQKDRDKLGIKTVQDLTNVVPGVSYSVGLDRFYVRGIGRTSNGGATDGGTAIYQDGVFTESSYAGAIPGIFQPTIQVLRGPQVTLFGRNAIGGALIIDAKHPDRTQTEEARVLYGALDRWEGGVRVSGPFPGTDQVRYSIGANYWDQGDGYLHNVNGGKNEGGAGTYGFVSGQIEADLTPNLNVWMKAENTTFDYSNRNVGISAAPWSDGFAASQLSYYPNSYWAARGLDPNRTDAINVTTLGPLQTENASFSSGDRYNFVGDTETHQTLRKNYSVAGHVSWDVGGTNLKYTAGAQRYFYNLYLDNDGTNVTSYTVPVTTGATPNPTCTTLGGLTPCATISGQTIGGYIEDRKWWTHELDWSSKGDGPLEWLAGVFYYKETEANPQYADNPGLAGQRYLTPFYLTGFPPVAAPANPSGHQYWYNQIVQSTSAAGFGQLDWKATDTLKASLGLRYTHDEKKMREELRVLCFGAGQWFGACGPALYNSSAFFPSGANALAYDITTTQIGASGVLGTTYPGVLNVAHIDPAGTGNVVRDLADSWNAVTGSFSLNWTPAENTLLYARYDRGYKAGAFTNALNIVPFPEADKETVNAYEVGAKMRPLDKLQTNLAIFYYDWSGRQTPITIAANTPPYTAGGPAASFFINLPKSISEGVELETTWTPFTDAHVRFNYAYLKSTVDQAPNFVDGSVVNNVGTLAGTPAFSSPAVSVVGNDLPLSPRNKVSVGGDYTFRPSMGPITVSGVYSWRDKDYAEIFNTSWRTRPAYGTLNLNAQWTDPSGRFSVFAFGNNVTDEQTYQYVTNSGVTIAAPISSGVGQNVLTGTYTAPLGGQQISTSVTSPLQASTYNANPARIWGIELRAKF